MRSVLIQQLLKSSLQNTGCLYVVLQMARYCGATETPNFLFNCRVSPVCLWGLFCDQSPLWCRSCKHENWTHGNKSLLPSPSNNVKLDFSWRKPFRNCFVCFNNMHFMLNLDLFWFFFTRFFLFCAHLFGGGQKGFSDSEGQVSQRNILENTLSVKGWCWIQSVCACEKVNFSFTGVASFKSVSV